MSGHEAFRRASVCACHPCAGGMGFRDQGLGFGFRACLGSVSWQNHGAERLVHHGRCIQKP